MTVADLHHMATPWISGGSYFLLPRLREAGDKPTTDEAARCAVCGKSVATLKREKQASGKA